MSESWEIAVVLLWLLFLSLGQIVGARGVGVRAQEKAILDGKGK